jgi:tetratricopeptide (TPR) repeat protein
VISSNQNLSISIHLDRNILQVVERHANHGAFDELIEFSYEPILNYLTYHAKLWRGQDNRASRGLPGIFRNPDTAEIILIIGKVLAIQSMYNEALKLLDNLFAMLPPDRTPSSFRNKFHQLSLLTLGIEQSSGNLERAFDRARDLILIHKFQDTPLFRLVGMLQRDLNYPRSHRRVLSLLCTSDHNSYLFHTYLGISYFLRGTFRQALRLFLQAFELNQESTLVQFLVGICSLLQATYLSSEFRNELVVQGFTFLNMYKRTRIAERGQDAEIEADYNIAVGCQTLSLFHHAIPIYREILRKNKLFVKESAINLACIYTNMDLPELVLPLLDKYITF